MHRFLLVLCLLVACKSKPKVELAASSCPDAASCAAECDRGVVVACDRLVPLTPDPTARQAVYRKGYELWSQLCDFGAPEACMAAAKTSVASRGGDPNQPLEQMARDKEACEYLEIWGRGVGTPLKQPCP
jgi:hypothetical protein